MLIKHIIKYLINMCDSVKLNDTIIYNNITYKQLCENHDILNNEFIVDISDNDTKFIIDRYIRNKIDCVIKSNYNHKEKINILLSIMESFDIIKNLDIVNLRYYFIKKLNRGKKYDFQSNSLLTYIKEINSILISKDSCNYMTDNQTIKIQNILENYIPNNFILSEYYECIEHIYNGDNLLKEINELIDYDYNQLKHYFYEQSRLYDYKQYHKFKSLIKQIDLFMEAEKN